MEPLILRPLAATDLSAWAEALTCWRPDSPRTAAELAGRDRLRTPGEVGRRFWVHEAGGQRTGVLELETPRTENQPGWLQLRVGTRRPEQLPRVLGLGVQRAQELGASVLVARVREDRPELGAHLGCGFAEYDRMFSSRLDLDGLDVGHFASKEAAALAGLQVMSLAQATQAAGLGEFAMSETAQRRLYLLVVSRILAVPGTVTARPWPFETWRERAAGDYDPTLVYVAVAPGGEWVGLTELFAETGAGTLRTGLTGVEPQWQGRGVAYALKLAALRAGLERGFRWVKTMNHQANAPMLAVNRALGFVPDPATVLLQREI